MGELQDQASLLEAPGRGLHSPGSMLRLEQIARLRARGIGNHIALPQLVVCGDQSAGKSSVLEGLTNIPFPRQDGLCTTFATEIILQHRQGTLTIHASLIPSSARTAEEKTGLEQYSAHLDSFEELPRVIQEVSVLMGIRQPGAKGGQPSFAYDVLRIEVQGPLGLHLSVVDLPGLITVPNEEQTDDDVNTVHNLVDQYVSDPRTIILAVVQAGNDIANQPIVQKARKHDPAGERTVGIITKPDLINKTSEKRIALLAANQDTTKLKLGFFLVKNPDPTELEKGVSPVERHKNEIRYFQSTPWKEQNLNPDRTGILALRTYLQQLLDKHIEKELPKVREDVRALLRQTETLLASFGEERSDIPRMRSYLTRLAMTFHQLSTSALNGTYEDVASSFFKIGSAHHDCRLRATVQRFNLLFAEEMRCNGAKRKIVASADDDIDADDNGDTPAQGQINCSNKEMKNWIKKVYQYSRGKELPGTYNYVLLAELFREQASLWLEIATDHVEDVGHAIRNFADAALAHVVADENVLEELSSMVSAQLRSNIKAAKDELQRLWEDEQHHPITYNHYFTDNVQKNRQQGMQNLLRQAMTQTREQDWHGKMHVSNTQVDLEKLLNGLQQRINVDMDEQACTEALSGLNAYYKVALKTFTDNVCRQVLERHLLRSLPGTFSPETVAGMDDDDLQRVARETTELSSKRKQSQALRENLVASLSELRRERAFKA